MIKFRFLRVLLLISVQVAFCIALSFSQSSALPLKPFTGQSIEEVKKFITDNNIVTLEQFLPTLSITTRANFVLMRQSHSLQPTDDPLQPRVIFFGDNARVIFAFNNIGESIEMMELPPGGEQFVFSRLNFNGTSAPTEQKHCMGCHLARPLWGQYRHWNGMYGGDQDRVPKGSLEEVDYLKFSKAAAQSPLYKNLVFKCGKYYQDRAITAGYVEDGFLSPDAECTKVSELLKNYISPERYERRLLHPAEGLGELLNRQNVVRVLNKAKKSPHYLLLHRIYAGNAMGCYGERVYDSSHGQDVITQIRTQLAPELKIVLKKVNDLLVSSPSNEKSLQGQMLNLLGINIDRDIRMDLRTPNKINLGNDCDENSKYSPGDFCNYTSNGYSAYSDGTDMATNLLGYVILKEIYLSDSAVRTLLDKELAKLQTYFESLPPDSGEGYDNVKAQLSFLKGVIDHLNSSSVDPADIPKYIHDYPFIQLLKLGQGLELCRLLAR